MAYEDGNGDLGVIINAEMMILKGAVQGGAFLSHKNRVVKIESSYFFTIYDKTEKR